MLKRNREQVEHDQELFHGHGSRWFRGPVIGKKKTSTIFLATLKKPKCRGWPRDPLPIRMAVKSSKNWPAIIKEEENFSMLNGCPYICQYFGQETTFVDEQSFRPSSTEQVSDSNTTIHNLLLEYASGGNLNDLVKKSGPGGLSEADVRHYTRCVLKGLDHVHRHGYVVNGLKSENILLYPSITSTGSKFDAKIGDLESAEKVQNINRSKNGEGILSSEPVDSRVPEPALDVWDLGCVLLEMLLGKSMSEGNQKIVDEISGGSKFPKVMKNISEDAKDFVKSCLGSEPEDRLTEMLLKHPFVAESVSDEELEQWQGENEAYSSTCPKCLDDIPLEEEASREVSDQISNETKDASKSSSSVDEWNFIPLEVTSSQDVSETMLDLPSLCDEVDNKLHFSPCSESLDYIVHEEEASEDVSDPISSIETEDASKSSSSVDDWNFIPLEVTSSQDISETMLDFPSQYVAGKPHSSSCPVTLDYIQFEEEASEEVSDPISSIETEDAAKSPSSVDDWSFIPIEVTSSHDVSKTMLDLPSPCDEVDDKQYSSPCIESLDYIPLEVKTFEQVSDPSSSDETKDISKPSWSFDDWNFIPLEVNGY